MSTASPDVKKPAARAMSAYLAGLGIGAMLCLFSYILLILLLDGAGALPPPQFSNSACVDEKLRFLRANRTDDADLLILGSSVAWRHFDGTAAAGIALRARNAAFCQHNLSQTKAIANWLLPRLKTARTVVVITSPLDYQGCKSRPQPQFSVEDANAYVFEGATPFFFYFRYFDPFTLVKNASTFTKDRTDFRQWGTLVMNRFGDAPMDPPGSNQGKYGEEVGGQPEAACVSALRSMALDIHKSGRRLIVVDTPISPKWKARYDPNGTALDHLSRKIDDALRDTGAERWNGDAAYASGSDGFFDAIHLRWPTAQDFARTLVRAVVLDPQKGNIASAAETDG